MRYSPLVVILASALLAGCGIAAKVSARNDMEQSKVAYKNCLAQNPSNVSACEGSRTAYEVDMKAYRATSAGIMPGRNDTININSEMAR